MKPLFNLCLVTDPSLFRQEKMIAVIMEAIVGGVDAVQLRAKTMSAADFMALGQALKKHLDAVKIPLIINDHVKIALELDAAGVHIGQSDMPYQEARALLGDKKIIGLTVENFAQAQAANDLAVDYLGVGPIFPTQSKADASPAIGIEGLKAIREISQHHLTAIGGVNIENIQSVLNAGADSVAVISAIYRAKNPQTVANALVQCRKYK